MYLHKPTNLQIVVYIYILSSGVKRRKGKRRRKKPWSYLPHFLRTINTHPNLLLSHMLNPHTSFFIILTYLSLSLHFTLSNRSQTTYHYNTTTLASSSSSSFTSFYINSLSQIKSNMATIVCQGLKSCLHDPQLVEPRTLQLRLSSPIPRHLFSSSTTTLESGIIKPILSSEKCHHDKPDKNSDLGSTWSFLQALTSSQQQCPSSTPVYGKPSSSITRLNQKSLELCTENLGNESGTIFIENDIFDFKDEDLVKNSKDEKKQGSSLRGKKGVARVHEFPPPLTTISGTKSLQVRPHREEGRLILKAVKSPLKHACFQVERSNGRVRLSVSKDFYADPKIELEPQIEASQEEIEAKSVNENKEKEEEVEKTEKVVLGEQEGRKVSLIEEKGLKNESEEERGKFGRAIIIRRCKEGSEQEKKNGLIKFEPCYWVAT